MSKLPTKPTKDATEHDDRVIVVQAPSSSPSNIYGAASKVTETVTSGISTGSISSRITTGILLFLLVILVILPIITFQLKDPINNGIQYLLKNNEKEKVLQGYNIDAEKIYQQRRTINEILKENALILKTDKLVLLRFHTRDINNNFSFVTARNWFPLEIIDKKSLNLFNQNMGNFGYVLDTFMKNECYVKPQLSSADPLDRLWLDRGSRGIIICPVHDTKLFLIGMFVAEYNFPLIEERLQTNVESVRKLGLILGGSITIQEMD